MLYLSRGHVALHYITSERSGPISPSMLLNELLLQALVISSLGYCKTLQAGLCWIRLQYVGSTYYIAFKSLVLLFSSSTQTLTEQLLRSNRSKPSGMLMSRCISSLMASLKPHATQPAVAQMNRQEEAEKRECVKKEVGASENEV